LIGIGNASGGAADLGAVARRLLDDPSPLVRGTAVWAFGRLTSTAQVKLEAAPPLSGRDRGVGQGGVAARLRLACRSRSSAVQLAGGRLRGAGGVLNPVCLLFQFLRGAQPHIPDHRIAAAL